jgi:hypothetical protein
MADPMPDPALAEAKSNTDRFFTQVHSLHGFDTLEVHGVITSLLSPTQEESCHVATYLRSRTNVESLLELKTSKHVQAIAMIARALFELAVDLRLLETTPNGWIKMSAHADLEKLGLARKIVVFKNANPDVHIDTAIYQSFIDQESVRIDALRKSVWPKHNNPRHWSGMDLRMRCANFAKAIRPDIR